MSQTETPDVLFLLATGCHHCPSVLETLNGLLKQGRIGRLEAINIVAHPEVAGEVGTRSVPWTRVGQFELEGALTPGELDQWVARAAANSGVSDYFVECLGAQRPDKVIAWLDRQPENLVDLLELLSAESTPMAARIGVGVVMEQLEGDPRLRDVLPTLTALCQSSEANIRADAAHFLGLTRSPEAKRVLNTLLEDDHPDVREIAADSLKLV
ncbi:MAG: HEAT repeat domain-containing protein [Chromatiales bacterium]|nr:HEAT repeat domain-containing protein [Chromatiales bacterium]